MRILTRYLLKQHTAPFVFSLTALTGFLLLNQIARRLGDLIGKGLPWTVILEFFLLTIPYVVAMTLSMSVLVAVLYTFSHLESDSEITAIRAGGVSLGQLVRPVLVAGIIVAAAAFTFGDQLLPRSNHRLRVLMADIARAKPTFSLKEHVVNEVQRGRVFLRAARIDPATYSLADVTIYRMAGPGGTSVVYADSGRISFAPNQEDLQLILYDGTVHDFDRSDPSTFQLSSYRQYLFKIPGVGNEFMRRDTDTFRGDRELGVCALEEVARAARRERWLARRRAEVVEQNGLRMLMGLPTVQPDSVAPAPRRSFYCRALDLVLPAELEAESRLHAAQEEVPRAAPRDSVRRGARGQINPTARGAISGSFSVRRQMNELRIQRDRARGAQIRAANYMVEFHKKYSIPAACIVFVLVGIPVALRFPQAGLGMVIGVGMIVFGAYYVSLIAGESLANKLKVSPALAMWAPNYLFGLLGGLGLWLTSRQGVAKRKRTAPTS